MTEPEAEYGERLRHALHAAADSVVPSGDGLERIRSRIAHEPARDGPGLLLGWLRAVTADVRASQPGLRPVIAALRSGLVPVVKSGLAAVTSIVVSLKPAVRRRPRAGGGWLRPALAAAAAALVAAAAILGSPGLRHTVAAQISSLLQHASPKPPASHPAITLVPGTPGPSPAIPLPSPSARPSWAKAPPRPIQPAPLPATCAPLTGQASPAATPAAAPRPARTTCQTQAPAAPTSAPAPTPPPTPPPPTSSSAPTPTLSPTPSSTPATPGSAQAPQAGTAKRAGGRRALESPRTSPPAGAARHHRGTGRPGAGRRRAEPGRPRPRQGTRRFAPRTLSPRRAGPGADAAQTHEASVADIRHGNLDPSVSEFRRPAGDFAAVNSPPRHIPEIF
jgi:hypothetical protein